MTVDEALATPVVVTGMYLYHVFYYFLVCVYVYLIMYRVVLVNGMINHVLFDSGVTDHFCLLCLARSLVMLQGLWIILQRRRLLMIVQ